ncbi:hypothetical protein Hdeb2414_s0015g00443701 [Helianthus debilis subsp. tardiflorus]
MLAVVQVRVRRQLTTTVGVSRGRGPSGKPPPSIDSRRHHFGGDAVVVFQRGAASVVEVAQLGFGSSWNFVFTPIRLSDLIQVLSGQRWSTRDSKIQEF